MILMQRNINFSLFTARVRFRDSGKDYYHYKTRGSVFFVIYDPNSVGLYKKTTVLCGYVPIRKNIIMEVTVGAGDIYTRLIVYQKYLDRITTNVDNNKIELKYENFGKEDEGIVQCVMMPDSYSRRVHLIYTGECIHLPICAFKCALAGTMCL